MKEPLHQRIKLVFVIFAFIYGIGYGLYYLDRYVYPMRHNESLVFALVS